jgi:hypothetical protein
MELFDNLASIGLTTRVLQFLIIGGIAVFLIGMYWKYIVIGAGILFCVTVFAMSSGSISSKTDPAAVVAPEDVVPAEFIDDCLKYGENATKISCEKLWRDEGNGKE